MNKRIRSLLLCLVMVFTLAATAVPALAASTEPALVSDGDSTEAAPVSETTPSDGDNENNGNGNGSNAGNENNGSIPVIPNQPINTIPKISIPFTKTVVKGGDVAPGEKSFDLELIKNDGTDYSLPTGLTATATVSTNGVGDYNGELVITGNAEAMANFEPFSFFVREAAVGDTRWTCDESVYFVSISKNENAEGGYAIGIQNAESNGNGGYQVVNGSPSVAMTFENTYTESAVTLRIPFTKTVKLGGDVAPGAQDFELELLGFVDQNGEANYPGVSYTATVSTNGAGDYNGELIITGPESQVVLVTEELYVREKNTGADKWTYSDAVWCVRYEDGGNGPSIYPTKLTGDIYEPDYEASAAEKMAFENTYTANKPAPTATPKPGAPKTGDESALALWLTLLLVGTVSAGIVIGTRKKSSR